jgi:DNA-binding LacI/PurR family transcriptional regulator
MTPRRGDRTRHASIVDVARRAGVSPATVSRALRGLPVAPTTRQRVLAAAAELSYVVSPAASRLAGGATRTVAAVVPFLDRWFFAETLVGLAEVLAPAGYDLVLHHLGDRVGCERFFTDLPVRRRVDAVVLLAVPLDVGRTALLRQLGVPVVAVGPSTGDGTGPVGVGVDDEAAAGAVTRFLLHAGHRRLVLARDADAAGMGFEAGAARERGVRRAVEAAGATVQVLATPRWGVDGGLAVTRELLAGAELPTAVVAEYDEIAFGVLQGLAAAGVDVPGRVSVVGFDDHPMAELLGLTTVRQPVRDQGRRAGRRVLLALSGGPDAAAAPPREVLGTELVVRSSTGPAGGGRGAPLVRA